jgi:hypothetical protein
MKGAGPTMQGMSERQHAVQFGLSRGAIQKSKETGRLWPTPMANEG